MEQVVRSLAQAYRIIKEMHLFGDEGSDYRSSCRESLREILEDRMHDRIDRHFEGMAQRDEKDRRNGSFSRHLLTELGDISVCVPRTQTMSGVGAVNPVVLVALGMTKDGQNEVIDFTIAHEESENAWDAFLSDLYRRRLRAEGLELIITDGGTGLLAALPLVYPGIPTQRCWAHKTRNILDHI
jgi:transposase-like protein